MCCVLRALVVFIAWSSVVHETTFLKGNSMENNEVTIVDIKMPFLSMVIFMVKSAVAAIPAVIILAILIAILGAMFGGMFGGYG